MLGVQRGTINDNGLAHTHRGFEEPHYTLASSLHGGDRPFHMTASGGRSSQPLYIRHMALDGSLPDVADPVNVGYFVTGPSLAGHFGDKHITHGRSTRPRPTPPDVPDFTPQDVYNADSDKLRQMLLKIQSTVPDLQSNPFWEKVLTADSGDAFKNQARALAMHWADVYGAGNNGSVNAAGEYQAWLNTVFDPDDVSGGTTASGTTLTPDWSSVLDYWAPTIQSEIASGSSTSAMVASLQQGNYYPTAQTGEALDFSQIGDNWTWLKTNARQTALSIGAEFSATVNGNPSGFQKLPDQPVMPDIFSTQVKGSDNYADSRNSYAAALGMALSKIRVSYLNALNAPPAPPSDLPDIAVLVGAVGVGGLLLWWWMK